MAEFGGGIFESTDAGEKWLAFNRGLTTLNIATLTINSSDSTKLFAATDQGLFKVDTTAGLWERVALSGIVDEKTSITALFQDKDNPTTLFLAADKQLLTSIDSGLTWTLDDSSLLHYIITQIAVHPSSSSTLFVSTKGGGIYASSVADATPSTSTTSPTLDLATKTPSSD